MTLTSSQPATVEPWIHLEESGDTARGPTLVFVHGLACTAEVWEPAWPHLARTWRGALCRVDLPGHGRSSRLGHYSFGSHAAALGGALRSVRQPVLVGHSLGGVVALALASGWFGVSAAGVIGLGMKLRWSDEELEKAAAGARRPPKTWDDAAEARAGYLRLVGLTDLVDADGPIARAGVVDDPGGGYRLAFHSSSSPTATAAAHPLAIVRSMAAAVTCPMRMVCGTEDPGVTVQDLREFDPDAVGLPGRGHNPHVEDPREFTDLVAATARAWISGP